MSTPLISPFTREAAAEEVSEGVDLTAKRAVVTGGASGIGIETGRVLALRGADVTIAARRLDAAKVAREIIAVTGNPNVHTAALGLTDRKSVAQFAETWWGRLDLLINNAGVMMVQDLTRSADGREMQFATNHLGHFDLSTRLHGALAGRSTSGDAELFGAPVRPGRVRRHRLPVPQL